MRENKLYANLKKCIFCAPEIPVLGSYVSTEGVRAGPEKIEAICAWPVPQDQKQLRQCLGLATYLHHYSKNFAATIRPLSQLLKGDTAWSWRPQHQTAFDVVKTSLSTAPVLMLPDHSKAFHVVCDASNFAIGCALMQLDDEGRERVVSYQSRQPKPAERNYPVHDKELLAMRYALITFRVYLLGEQTFAVYTDHASLRTATKSPPLSQCMARWLSLFSEYNFVVHDKPGKTNILVDALSRRPDYVQSGRHAVGDEDDDECTVYVAEEVAAVEVAATTPLRDLISAAYESDAACTEMIKNLRDPSDTARRRLSTRSRACIDRYQLDRNLLTYSVDRADPPRIVVPMDDDLRARLIHEFHDAPSGGHLGREKTFARLLLAAHAPLRPLPVAADPWSSVGMDFVFGLPRDAQGRTGILVFVDRFSKMVHHAPVAATITAQPSAAIFLGIVYRHHSIPTSIVSDRDPRFTAAFWKELFKLVGTRLAMSTALHPETDGQTERANRVVEDVLRSFATSFRSWSSFLPMVEFAINNAEHASTGLTPLYINFGRHPRVPALLGMERPIGPDGERDDDTGCERDHDENSARVNGVLTRHGTRSAARVTRARAATTATPTRSAGMPTPLTRASTTTRTASSDIAAWTNRTLINPIQRRRGIELEDESGAGEVAAPPPSNFLPNPEPQPRDAADVNAFLQQRESVMRYVRDAIADAVDRQKEYADQRGRKGLEQFAVGDRVLLSTAGIQPALVTNLGASKLAPHYIGPFKILKRSTARDEPPSVPAPGAPSAPARVAAAASPRPPPGGHAARFRRDGPAPLVDSAGHERRIVEAILGHDDSRRAVPQRAHTGRGTRAHAGPIPMHRRYLVRWLGPMDDSWEPREVLLADTPDCVEAYEASLPQGATPRRA
ncbi:unnamed protein product [Phytophthora fragariaefolia]|uniref:Unnamed protein product n=1 Tax=Phytophthora fragariaefolia TaxID=1490495 RepID=A0A9W6U250_9STRA|nr:unnamed protein product [Phytophthora fragariaefolia]